MRDTDKGYRRTVEAIRTLRGHLTVGVHAEEGAAPHGDGSATVAEIAVLTEYGSADGHVEAQAWLRGTIDTLRERLERALARAAERVVRLRERRDEALTNVGEQAVNELERAAPRATGQLAEAIRARLHLDRRPR